MAFGYLTAIMIMVSIISIAGLVLMYLIKEEKAKKYIFYAMAIWGTVVGVITAASMPAGLIFLKAAAWAAALLGIAGIVISVAGKTRKHRMYAFLAVTISVIGSLVLFILM